jgi:hypothetical protein
VTGVSESDVDRERLRDELRLPAVALGRHDHAARDRVGHLRAELEAQQVQTGIQPPPSRRS